MTSSWNRYIEFRSSLALATESEVVKVLINKGLEQLRDRQGSPRDQHASLCTVSWAAYYMYLLGGAKEPIENILLELDSAASQLASHNIYACSSMLVATVARHRLYRNWGLDDKLEGVRSIAKELAEQIVRSDPRFPLASFALAEWSLEDAHYSRYGGHSSAALSQYCQLWTSDWHVLGSGYARTVLLHYFTTLGSDWLEALLPFLHTEKMVGAIQDRLRKWSDVLCLYLDSPLNDGRYPLFYGYGAKHRALILALKGQSSLAEESMRAASTTLERLGAIKGKLLCDEFQALINAIGGNTTAALQALHAVARGAGERNYPRLASLARFHSLGLSSVGDPCQMI